MLDLKPRTDRLDADSDTAIFVAAEITVETAVAAGIGGFVSHARRLKQSSNVARLEMRDADGSIDEVQRED